MKNDRSTSRREFLKKGTVAMAGMALGASGGCADKRRQTPENRQIIRRTLGRTGLELPVVSMGSCYAINLVRAALAEGIVYIHTSAGYSEQNHERLLGKVFRDRPRDSFVVATSPDLPYRYDRGRDRSYDIGHGIDPSLIAESLDGSLKRMGLDHVDIFYLTSVGRRDVVLYEPYLEAFGRLKQSGKTSFVGIGTHENEPEVIRAATESGFWDVVLTAYNFRQSHHAEISAAMGEAAAAGLGVVAMKTQAGVYWDRRRTRKINMPAALKWALRNEHVHTSIPAFSNFDEMEEDLGIMADLSLTEQERRDLEIGVELGYSGCFCQQCGDCLAQCPAGLDIPTLMRSYMYAFAHGQPGKARATLQGWNAADVACADCRRCEVRCSLGFDVRSRSLEIARILDVPEEFLG